MSTVRNIPEKYLWCRDVAHSWDPYDAKTHRNRATRKREVHQVLICTRCATLKTRMLSSAGEVLRNSYSYPVGYLQSEQGRLSPADRAMIRRINLDAYLKSHEEEDEE